MWSSIVGHCASSREDLPAAPPGSPLALPLIYSLIHLCCCHMASLFLPPPSPAPSITPFPSLPLLISQSCSSRGPLNQGMPLHSLLPPFHFSFSLFLPPLAFCLPALLQQGPLPPSPMLQFTPKVSADPILPPSAIDVSLSESLGSCVMQTRLSGRECRGGGRRVRISVNKSAANIHIHFHG